MTLFTKNGFCPACREVENFFKAHNVKFNKKYLTSKQKAKAIDFGYMRYPIVCPNDQLFDKKNNFTGLDMDKLNRVISNA